MLFFNMRKRIENEYKEWLQRYPSVADCPFNVITFLSNQGYLKEEEIVEKFRPFNVMEYDKRSI